jgi:hypothetical protein
MSNNIQEWDDFEDDFEDDFDEQPTPRRASGDDVVKKLRRAERSQSKRIKELESELTSLRKTTRDTSVKSILESKGISPKIAAFIPQDIDVESSDFDSWLEDYADVFGVPSANAGTAVDPADLAALRQIDAVTSGAVSPDRAEDALLRINQAQTEEELLNLIFGSE